MKHWSLSLRWAVVLATGLAYGGAACLTLLLFIEQQVLAQVWPWFLVTTLFSLVFLGSGSVVWLYARQRRVAWLFFALCLCLAVSLLFAVPASVFPAAWETALSSLGASLGMLFFFFLLLQFPRPLLPPFPLHSWRARLVWGWVLFLTVLNGFSDSYCLTGMRFPPAALFEPFYLGSFLAMLVSIAGAFVVAARTTLSRRERQQRRVLAVGLGLGFAPWICFTLLPSLVTTLIPALALPILDGLWTAPTLLLVPLTLGYTILRYQMLVLDAVIARIVSWLLGVLSLVLCGYVLLVCGVVLPHTPVIFPLATGTMAGVSPVVWHATQHWGQQLFGRERMQDHLLMSRELGSQHASLDLLALSHAFQRCLTQTCSSQAALLLIYDEDSGLYRMVASPDSDERAVGETILTHFVLHRYPAPPAEEWAFAPGVTERLLQARRPLFAQDVRNTGNPGAPTARASGSESCVGRMLEPDALLVPLLLSGELFGLALIGPRMDQHAYAGADVEVIHQIRERFLPLLAEASRQAKQRERTRILEIMLHSTAEIPLLTLEDFAMSLVDVTARSIPAQVELWQVRETRWQRLACAGTHPRACPMAQMRGILARRDWTEGVLLAEQGLTGLGDSLALLPLVMDGCLLGCLLFQYNRPRRFSSERRQLFTILTTHVATMFHTALRVAAVQPSTHTLAPGGVCQSAAMVPNLAPLFQHLPCALHTLSRSLDMLQETGVSPTGTTGLVAADAHQWQELRHHWSNVHALIDASFSPRVSSVQNAGAALLPLVRHREGRKHLVVLSAYPLLTRMLVTGLEDEVYHVVVHQTPCQALQWIQQQATHPALLIIDGEALSFDLTVFVHALAEYLPILPPVLLLTAPSKPPGTVPSCVYCLPKPLTLDQVRWIVGITEEHRPGAT